MNTERVSGFSLVEVMIAVAVFAIIILAVGQAAMMGQIASNEVKEQTNILLGCQQIMDQLLVYSLDVLQAQDGSTFSVRALGPDSPLVEGGIVVVDANLNGDGDTGDIREGRNDILRVALYYKKAETSIAEIKRDENLILQRVVTLRQ